MRSNVVDIIKGIAILMIVNVHLISGPFFSFGETFHVIAFFFTVGIVHGMGEKWSKLSWGLFIKKRAIQLLYPYFALSICSILFHILLNLARGEFIINDDITIPVIKTVLFRGVGTLWFLPVLFIGDVLFFGAKKKHMNDLCIFVAGLVSVFLSSFLNAYGICGGKWYDSLSMYGLLVNTPITILLASLISVFFIEIGYILYKAIPAIFVGGNLTNKRAVIILVICVLSLSIDIISHSNYVGDLHKLNIGDPLYYLICSFSGLVFVCAFSILIEHFCHFISRVFIHWGRNSLIIMTTHAEYYFNSIANLLVVFLLSSFDSDINVTVVSALSLLLIMLIEMLIVYIVNHSLLKKLFFVPTLFPKMAR